MTGFIKNTQMQIDNIPYQIKLEFEYPLFHLTGSANLGNLLTSGLFMWDIQLTGGKGVNVQGSLCGRCIPSLAGSRHPMSTAPRLPEPGTNSALPVTRSHCGCCFVACVWTTHSLSLCNVFLSTRLQTTSGQGPAYSCSLACLHFLSLHLVCRTQ